MSNEPTQSAFKRAKTNLPMNFIVTIAVLMALFTTAVRAESSYERELQQLTEQRDKAIAAAVDPINRRYQTSLEQLLKRATQGNDLVTAVKIKAQIEKIHSAAPPDSEAQFRSALMRSKWSWRGIDILTFTDSGEANLSKANSTSKYKITGQRTVVLTSKVSGRTATLEFNASVTEFTGTDFDGRSPATGAQVK